MKITKEQKMTINILFWALIFGRFIFAYLLCAGLMGNAVETDDRLMVNVVVGAAILVGAISFLMHKKSYERNFLLNDSAFFNGNVQVPSDFDTWSKEKITQWKIVNKFQTISMLSWAMAESIAIFGLILPFLGGSIDDGLVFMVFSLVLGLYERPNFTKLENTL